MKAVIYRDFRATPAIEQVEDPTPGDDGVVIRVKASGVCRSDWHGWQGHDADIELPHVPGHEFAGIIEAVGRDVSKWQIGDRVTVPFVGGCGRCEQCVSGNHQVCDFQFQAGFTHWGSFADALGAQVVAIDVLDEQLALAKQLGAVASVNADLADNVAAAVREVSDGGVHVSVDAIGDTNACFNSIESLRKRGKHIQVGLMVAEDKRPRVPMDKVVANELEILGSHGMQAHRYDEMLDMITAGKLSPEKLIGDKISLEDSIAALTSMNESKSAGVTVITSFQIPGGDL